MKLTRKAAVAALCFMSAACGGTAVDGAANQAATDEAAAEASETDRRTIAEALEASADHAALFRALRSAGLAETFRGAGPYTVFAPVEAAFAAVPQDVRSRLESADQRERLIALLSYHVVPGTVTVADMAAAIAREGGRAELATVTGASLRLSREGEAIIIEDGSGARARVTAADQIQSNGVVHSIDTVLMPAG